MGTEAPIIFAFFPGAPLLGCLVLMLVSAIAAAARVPPSVPRIAFFLLCALAPPVLLFALAYLQNPLFLGTGAVVVLGAILTVLEIFLVLLGLPMIFAAAATRVVPRISTQVLSVAVRVLAVVFAIPYAWLAFQNVRL